MPTGCSPPSRPGSSSVSAPGAGCSGQARRRTRSGRSGVPFSRRARWERGAARGPEPDRPLFYRLPDLHLRGLLHLLRDDPRLQTFVERELGALLANPRGAELLAVLGTYLAAGGNKAEAAKNSHLARPTFYERLRRIERILGVSLASAESRASLHVALLAHGSARPATQPS